MSAGAQRVPTACRFRVNFPSPHNRAGWLMNFRKSVAGRVAIAVSLLLMTTGAAPAVSAADTNSRAEQAVRDYAAAQKAQQIANQNRLIEANAAQLLRDPMTPVIGKPDAN